jgi:hypothetical protein
MMLPGRQFGEEAMTRRFGRVGSASVVRRRRAVLVWVLALLVGASATVADGAGRARAAPSAPSKSVCPEKPRPGHFTCLSRKRTDTRARSAIEGALPQFVDPVKGYGPADLQSAYNIPADRGAGATVAVVDAYDDPNAEADLAAYRSQFGLPACGSSDGCFRKVGQTGGAVPYPDTVGWATEAMLDIDMVSAACPLCHILLVEATSDYETDLAVAANWAAGQPGVRAVSNSYGSPEGSSDTAYGAAYYAHPGVAMVASAGDTGYGVVFPAASPYVISVGGTSLAAGCAAPAADGTCPAGQRKWSETVWNDLSSAQGATGSGCSAYEPKPAWQHDGCAHRTVADLSAVADPATGVAVYDTWGSNQDPAKAWNTLGGTSAAAPLIAAMIAEANPAHPSASYAYVAANSAGLNDVTTGTNSASACVPVLLCKAGAGYDGPTGQGTPSGLLALGGPGSTVYPLDVAACPTGNRLTNPGLESGATGWAAPSGAIGKHTKTGAPHSGKWSVVLDGTGHARTDRLSQKIGFPASCRSATVSFWLKINTTETTTTAKHDTMVVTLGAAPIGTWSNLQHSRYKNYLHVSVRVSLPLDNYNAWSGATLLFAGTENGSKQTTFVIDDVSLTLN